MRSYYDKFIIGELISMALAILVSIIALIKGSLLYLILSLLLIACSMICDSMLFYYANQTPEAGKQLLRAILLIILAIFLSLI